MANTLRFKRGLVSTIPTALAGEPLFTTDTFDLYIGNGTGNTRFQKYIASGTTSQLLRGDGSLYTFPLAISSPSAGQVLKYNGTSWVNDSDAGITGSGSAGQVAFFTGATTQSGSNNLFWDSANARLGIGTNTPNSLLNLYASDLPRLRFSSGSSGDAWIDTFGTSFRFINNSASGTTQISGNGQIDIYTAGGSAINFSTSATQRARITSTGNFIINNASTDNGLRFQVTGDGYFSGSVGIGAMALTDQSLLISKNISGSTIPNVVHANGVIQSSVTNATNYFITGASTAAASFTLPTLRHYIAVQSTFGAGSAVTNQFGFFAHDSLIGATNNYGFYGNIASGTGRWNLYMNGTASNYMAGALGIGTATLGTHILTAAGTVLVTGQFIRVNQVADVYINSNYSTGFAALQVASNHGLQFATNNTTRMTLDASGNLGLGVVPSAWTISGAKAIQVGPFASLTSNTSGGQFTDVGHNIYGNYNYLTTAAASFYRQGGGQHQWFTAPSGTINTSITFTQAMTLDASGNLGIGVINPAVRLEVAGTGTQQVRVTSTSGADMRINADTVGRVGTYSNSNLAIVTNGVAIGTFFTTGNLSLNSVVDAGYKLDVNGTMRVSGVATFATTLNTARIQLASNTTYSGILDYSAVTGLWYFNNQTAAASSATDYFQFQADGAAILTLKKSGAATFSSSVTAGGAITLTTNNTYIYGKDNVGNTPRLLGINSGNSTYIGPIDAYAGGEILYAVSANVTNQRFYTNGSERMRITSGGNTILAYSGPDTGELLQVYGTIKATGAATFSSTAQAAGFITSGGAGYAVINSASNTVTALRPTGGGASIMSTNSNGLHIAVGTQAAGDLILASNNTERIRLSSNGFFSQLNATNPSASITDSYIQYSADVTAGNAAPHFRTENGAVIKLYQETTGVGNSIISLGGGNAVLDDTTFDGYTLRQIVKALRNQGILA